MNTNLGGLNASALNRSQRKFCKSPITKNVRLLAPAGSGKTYALLWRCKYITEECKTKGLAKPHFLIVTFTTAAKFELEERLHSKEFKGIKITISTLNAWGWEYLKNRTGRELITTGYARRNLVTHDLLPICKQFPGMSELLKSSRGQAKYGSAIIGLIDLYKSLGFTHLMSKSDYNNHIKELKSLGLYSILSDASEVTKKIMGADDEKAAYSEFWSFWKKTTAQLESINRFTMEDQKYWPRVLLEERINDRQYASPRSRYSHIMVDEFQDINPLDMALINAISLYHGNGKKLPITIVGDDDQAIFGWRGTTPKYILYPEEYFSQKFTTCILDTNYRSPKAIVEASHNLIEHNAERVKKDMKSAAKGRAVIKIEHRKSPIISINSTVALAHKLIEEKGCESVALIGRRQATIFPYQIIFSAENTKYNVDADIDIFDGEAMKSLQDILKIVYRAKLGDDDDPVGNILTICDKVDSFPITVAEKKELAKFLDRKNPETLSEATKALHSYTEEIRKLPVERYYRAVMSIITAGSVYDFMKSIDKHFDGFNRDFRKVDEDNHYKNPQFLRLMDISKRYDDNFIQFSKDIEKARRNAENCRERNRYNSAEDYKDNKKNKIHLLTATRSKGRQFDAVIVLDAIEGEWPIAMSDNIEEERRLFYVAMTRAKKYLYFTKADVFNESRFLSEAGLIV